MKKHIALLCCVLAVSATAQTQAVIDVLKPSPISVGITVAHWMLKQQKRVFYVEVTGEGSTLEQARQHGFRMAVERAVGTIVSSETEVENSRLQRDEIITYASGYVSDFRVDNQYVVDGRTRADMRVWVSHSALANRLLNASRDSGTVEGARISEQIRSVQNERQSADRLLATVLSDYPKRAFDISLDPARTVLTAQRQGELQLSFTVNWNKHYLTSLSEAVQAINQRTDCGKFFTGCKYTSSIVVQHKASSYFDDVNAYDRMQREMVLSRPQVRLVIKDQNNTARFSQCFSLPELSHSGYASSYYADVSGYSAVINSQKIKKFTVNVDLSKLPTSHLDRVDIDIIRSNRCS